MRFKIRINDKTGMAYFPDDIREAGFVGELEGISTSLSLVFVRPGASVSDILKSLELIEKDLRLETKYQAETK